MRSCLRPGLQDTRLTRSCDSLGVTSSLDVPCIVTPFPILETFATAVYSQAASFSLRRHRVVNAILLTDVQTTEGLYVELTMGDTFAYVTRIVPALTVLSFLILAFICAPAGGPQRGGSYGEATGTQLVFGAYVVFLHLLSILFPARVVWAIGDVTQRIKEAADDKDYVKRQGCQIVKKCAKSMALPAPLMVIVLPAYKEEMATLEETLSVLASHIQARSTYHVCIGCLTCSSHPPV